MPGGGDETSYGHYLGYVGPGAARERHGARVPVLAPFDVDVVEVDPEGRTTRPAALAVWRLLRRVARGPDPGPLAPTRRSWQCSGRRFIIT